MPRWSRERARELDTNDPLAALHDRFALADGLVYLAGNSLGALGRAVPDAVARVVAEEWGRELVAGWSGCGWMEAPARVGDKIAPLIGAEPGEVLVCDTTSVALAKLLGAALAARPGRRVILSSTDNFPSDLYAAAAVAQRAGAELRVVDRSELGAALGPDVAVCCLTQVDYRTAALFDVASVTAAAHDVGALSLWDLCHSAGVVPVGCRENGIDLAVGCGYKYLNGGPGAPSFLYVRRELHEELENPIPGWLGHDFPFDFDPAWRPASGIRRFLTSTPSVVAVAALEAALSVFEGVSIEDLRAKSVSLGQLFIETIEDLAPSLEVASPLDPCQRGSQVSLRHDEASELVTSAASKGIVGDHRPPDIARFGFSPLYLSYEEVFRAAETLAAVAASLVSSPQPSSP